MMTYKGRFRMARAMNDSRTPKVVDVELETPAGRKVIDLTVAETDVARMLLGSFMVPCEVTDYRNPAPAEIRAAFKAGVAWQEGVGARQADATAIDEAAVNYSKVAP